MHPSTAEGQWDTAKAGPLGRRKMHLMAYIPDCALLQGMNIVLILFLDSLCKVLVDIGKYLAVLCIELQLM